MTLNNYAIMNEYFDEVPDFKIDINPPGERENMIHRIDPEELTDQCGRSMP
jgi:hypothetical protein